MSWNAAYAESTLDSIARDLDVRRIEAKDGKFFLKGTKEEVTPEPVPGGHFIAELMGLEGECPYQVQMTTMRLEKAKEIAQEARFAHMVCSHDILQYHLAVCSVVLYK